MYMLLFSESLDIHFQVIEKYKIVSLLSRKNMKMNQRNSIQFFWGSQSFVEMQKGRKFRIAQKFPKFIIKYRFLRISPVRNKNTGKVYDSLFILKLKKWIETKGWTTNYKLSSAQKNKNLPLFAWPSCLIELKHNFNSIRYGSVRFTDSSIGIQKKIN